MIGKTYVKICSLVTKFLPSHAMMEIGNSTQIWTFARKGFKLSEFENCSFAHEGGKLSEVENCSFTRKGFKLRKVEIAPLCVKVKN